MLVHSTTAEAENVLPSMIRKGNTRTLNWDYLKIVNRKGGKKMEVKGKKGSERTAKEKGKKAEGGKKKEVRERLKGKWEGKKGEERGEKNGTLGEGGG